MDAFPFPSRPTLAVAASAGPLFPDRGQANSGERGAQAGRGFAPVRLRHDRRLRQLRRHLRLRKSPSRVPAASPPASWTGCAPAGPGRSARSPSTARPWFLDFHWGVSSGRWLDIMMNRIDPVLLETPQFGTLVSTECRAAAVLWGALPQHGVPARQPDASRPEKSHIELFQGSVNRFEARRV